MKIISLQENLEKALSLINKLTVLKTQLPVTTNVLLKATEEEAVLLGTDLENTIKINIPAKIEKVGGVLIPTKTLFEIINSLPKEQVTIETQDLVVIVKAGKNTVKINGIAPEEFPLPPEVKDEKESDVSEIFSALKNVSFAASNDESRAVLTGILIQTKKSETTLVATDGFRLSFKKITTKGMKEGEKYLLPSKIISEIARIVTDSPVTLLTGNSKGQAIFSLEDITIYTRLIEGDFPSYQKIIPTRVDTKVVFDRKELLKAVKLSSIFAREAANIIKLKINKESVIISANAPQIGENSCEVEGKVEGDENQIAFNSRFLLDFLNTIDSDEIMFEMTGPLNPGVFKISGDESYLHIIMPVRVQE